MLVELKTRSSVRGYLNHETLERTAIRRTLDSLASELPETVIFGGMLRDFALGNARYFSSDIDLVSLASQDDISRAVARFSPKRNKFGGFRFSVGKRLFDIWAFEDTWAFREGLVEGRELSDLLKTTFFNVDASAYSLKTGKLYCSKEWEEGIRSRLLEINLADNPSPDRMVLRSIRMACEKKFSVGVGLGKHLVEHISLRNLDRVSCMFMLGLKRHIEHGRDEPFKFEPQQSLMSTSQSLNTF